MPTPPQSAPDNPLYEMFLKGAKGRPPIDKWHHYFDIYHRHFAPFRGRQPTVLEIGVQNGGSLHMWKEYFGPGARLFGADVDPRCEGRGPEGVKVFIGDQADPAFLSRIVAETGPIDVVIDDGGHTAKQMIVAFETLYPHVRAPGVYLVEDTLTQFWGGHYADDPRGRNFLQVAVNVVVELHGWTRQKANLPRLRTRPEKREAPLEVSALCRTTGSVAFYDSIVVFTREDRPEPWAELRLQDPDLKSIIPDRSAGLGGRNEKAPPDRSGGASRGTDREV